MVDNLPKVFVAILDGRTQNGWYQAHLESKPLQSLLQGRVLLVAPPERQRGSATGLRVLVRLQSKPTANKLRANIVRILPIHKDHIFAVITGDDAKRHLSFLRHDEAKLIGPVPPALDLPKPGSMVKLSLNNKAKQTSIANIAIDERTPDMDNLYKTSWDANKQLGGISLIAANIPSEFDDLENLPTHHDAHFVDSDTSTKNARTDLRDIPLVTIDDESARDFDDAVWASANKNGWRAIVAIADVAHYVAPNSALDEQAAARGNSVYLDDMVVPMLPESLSQGMCSLLPDRDRACMFVDINFDHAGQILSYKFARGIMRSHARLTYNKMQNWIDAHEKIATLDPKVQALCGAVQDTMKHLYALYQILQKCAKARNQLKITSFEHKVELDEDYRVVSIVKREQHDAHKLIEQMMIAANVLAAQTLLQANIPLLFRTHEPPPQDRLHTLADNLATLGVNATNIQTRQGLNKLLALEHPQSQMITLMVLRAQSQARYDPQHIGHFGLGLDDYCHFTSPIRRYADLIVHRALIHACKMPGVGGYQYQSEQLDEIGTHLGACERRAVGVERATRDRYLAQYCANHLIHKQFDGAVVAISKAGLWVSLDGYPMQGLLRILDLPYDHYRYFPKDNAIIAANGMRFGLSTALKVRIHHADSIKGFISLHYIDGGDKINAKRAKKEKRRKARRFHN